MKYFVLFSVLFLSGCHNLQNYYAKQEENRIIKHQNDCASYGFTVGTDKFAECVQEEVFKYREMQIENNKIKAEQAYRQQLIDQMRYQTMSDSINSRASQNIKDLQTTECTPNPLGGGFTCKSY